MIVDSLDNIEFYKNISENLYKSLVFLKGIDESIELGIYPITDTVKAISKRI
jgi:beta-galactosidase beta subunit